MKTHRIKLQDGNHDLGEVKIVLFPHGLRVVVNGYRFDSYATQGNEVDLEITGPDGGGIFKCSSEEVIK